MWMNVANIARWLSQVLLHREHHAAENQGYGASRAWQFYGVLGQGLGWRRRMEEDLRKFCTFGPADSWIGQYAVFWFSPPKFARNSLHFVAFTAIPILKSHTSSCHRHPLPIPANPSTPTAIDPTPAPPTSLPLLATFPCSLTPLTTLFNPVSTTTPPTIISPRHACSVSKLKIKSNSHTFSKSWSRASTKTRIRSMRARGDSVEVEIRMK